VDPSRYSRQIRVASIGAAGQERLRAASVLIVGIGALGTHAADALARAGTGRLWLCDRDVVDLSNLQRQVLFDEDDAHAGTPKAVAAATRLQKINSECAVTPLVADCTKDLLDDLPAVPDLILDGTDNFPTRYLLNDWAALRGRPWIYAGAVGTEGTAMVVRPGGPCLRCLWPEPPPVGLAGTCDTAGILAPVIAAVTAFQVAEALKLLTGAGDAVTRGVFTCDVWRGSWQVLGAGSTPAADCPVCQGRTFPALVMGPAVAVTLCGRDAVQIDQPQKKPLDLDLLAAALRGTAADVERTAHLLRFRADGCRFSVFPGGRTLVFGTQDPLRARALYDRWIGA
jgi:adenylyltransferase/sulfurtransferase